jgi:type II secretory pathway predicted ATPase ExeA
MYIEANEFYGLTKFFSEVGYYETPMHQKLYNDLKAHIQFGGILAFTGSVGSGKTTLLNRIQNELVEKQQVIVSQSLSTEKRALTIQTLFLALFYDLAPKEKSIKVPTQNEKRERELIELMKKNKKPVVLFIDEAHDIHGLTLIGLKRLVETVGSKGCKLSIVLAGHPKLGNALSRATMEEIGSRTKTFSIDNAIGSKEKYIIWLINQCLQDKKKYQEIITDEAIQKLATALQTPLQIQDYLTKAIQQGHQLGEKIITKELIEQVLRADLNSLEAQLVRNGYQFKSICELLNATPKETNEFLQGKLNSQRKSEFIQKLRDIGIVI